MQVLAHPTEKTEFFVQISRSFLALRSDDFFFFFFFIFIPNLQILIYIRDIGILESGNITDFSFPPNKKQTHEKFVIYLKLCNSFSHDLKCMKLVVQFSNRNYIFFSSTFFNLNNFSNISSTKTCLFFSDLVKLFKNDENVN